MKLITTIHLFFGYLNYISEGKISHEISRKNNKVNIEDGGLFFEQILFWKIFGNITLNEVLVILNGDCFNSLNELQENIGKEFNPKYFKDKSNFLKLILNEYSININNLTNNSEVYSTMRSSENGIFISRDPMKIILPYKAPVPLKKK